MFVTGRGVLVDLERSIVTESIRRLQRCQGNRCAKAMLKTRTQVTPASGAQFASSGHHLLTAARAFEDSMPARHAGRFLFVQQPMTKKTLYKMCSGKFRMHSIAQK
jgi:hypothetical protein